VRVKICGITNVPDAVTAAAAGADAIGLNFVGGPRRVTFDTADDVLEALPPFVTPVALVLLDHERVAPELYEWLVDSSIRSLQLYGVSNENSLQPLQAAGFRIMPVLRVQGPELCDASVADCIRSSCAVVLDAYDPAVMGGSGRAFQWEWVRSARESGRLSHWPPIILAGGLTSENVAEAIRQTQPYGVDVSSGVEVNGKPGQKDPEKLIEFVRAVRSAGE
jgi:phosphoribosylanthranilate isomerase